MEDVVLSYMITLHFEDDITLFIECEAGETVLDAAYRYKIILPMNCANGVCGTCKGLCERGSFDLGDEFLKEALSAEEAAGGGILTCQMVPSSDCVIKIPVGASMCKTQQEQFSASVERIEALSNSTIEISIKLDVNGGQLTFMPGQYIKIQVPETEQMRAYSFCSRSGEVRTSFLIRNVEGGLMSRYLTKHCRIGDVLQLIGPLGSFYLREVQRPMLFLAGGTGLAPFLAMLETLNNTGCAHRIHMLYGVNCDSDLVKLDLLNEFAMNIEFFSYTTCVLDETSKHPHKGYVTHHLDDASLNGGDVDVYLCGPPPMVDAVLTHFNESGITPANLYYEKFVASVPVDKTETGV